jgi:hypothetical protein
MIFESLKDHVVGSFYLAVAPRVGDQGVIDIDSIVLTEIPKGGSSKGCTQVGNDPVRHTEAVCDVSDELCRFFDVTFATGRTSIHLVNLSTATSMCL